MPTITAAVPAAKTSPNTNYQIFIIGLFFFIFGFVTWLNGILIPYLRIACELEEWQSYLVTVAFYISYAVMALPAGAVLKRTGMIGGMKLGLYIMAVGCLCFIPAATTRTYGLFLLGLFILGTGLTILQTASNPYITILGPRESAAKRISIMGICNKTAGGLAPFIMGAVILNNADAMMVELSHMDAAAKAIRLDELARKVILPYSVMAVILFILGFLAKYSKLPEIKLEDEPRQPGEGTNKRTIWQYPHLLLGFVAIFCSVATEVVAGDTISNYGLYHGILLDKAKHLTSYTLAFMILGYLFGAIAIPKYISQEKTYRAVTILGVGITLIAMFVPGVNSVYCIAALGMANAMIWPGIWPLAIRGLGSLTNLGSSILIMGIIGGGVAPLLYGLVARAQNPQIAYWVLIPFYLFNLYYAMSGHKIRPRIVASKPI